ncbi:cysteine-rich receptor-like protein kinase 42 [Rhodamnia argentea]|uniref:Cysteine-rich receptor-like protein kinase 42 n=1 Tax=Rhodamnia argentea TaxID=178133 RepID=A0A8B8P978_9MYRT|nr:cysteine-rich receptor-like protein kinase 42 [Rhodamnia argentea]
MRSSVLNPLDLACVFLVVFSSLFSPSVADPRVSEAGILCLKSNVTSTANIVSNFLDVMRVVATKVTKDRWASASVTTPLPEIYALAQCQGDLSQDDCLVCFAQSRTILPRCNFLAANSGRLYLDGCFIRSDYYNFFNETIDPQHDMVKCANQSNVSANQQARLRFADKVDRVLGNVTAVAPKNKGFAIFEEERRGGVAGVYALAQCWNTLNENGCRECLENAMIKARNCTPADEGRAMNAGCFMRYSTQKFYSYTDGDSPKLGIIIAIAFSSAAATSLVLISAYVGYRKVSKKKEVQKKLFGVPAIVRKSNLNFNYELLEKATKFFDDSRKLGQGGAGTVFKGILPDGRVVAVKRLVFNTRQWVDDFFNEVNLISGIQHKNLVRLLGCSIEGPESLLVYEYVPNRSLDQILFDKDATHILSWQERLNVISGTAEGLAFLHDACGVKIIHRDIKSSNVLLDEHLTAKIADFGLARCLDPEKSHLSTGIAGTLGYMAPEYLVKGQLTEKADVYSFGVLVLEILSGRKNSVFGQVSGSVLQSVWKHYKSNSLAECIDPVLKDKFPVSEALNVLQIALLCTQASPDLRPSMSEVVEMLNDRERIVPVPTQPPFLNSNLTPGDSSRSSNTNPGISNQLTNSEISSASTISLR